MKSLKSLIIDDEQPARGLIRKYLDKYPEVELQGEYDNGFDGLKAINELKPDVVFLDIQMPKLTGFEMLEVIDHIPEIIFTTAYDQYAIKAFEQNAVDYLLKPFSQERFDESITKLISRMTRRKSAPVEIEKIKKHLSESGEELSRIVIKKSGRIHVISTEKINYLEAQDDYVMVYTHEGKFLKQQTMKYFESHLNPDQFVRVHRSYIVNVTSIERIEPYEKTNYILILKEGSKVPVSRSGMQLLREKLDF